MATRSRHKWWIWSSLLALLAACAAPAPGPPSATPAPTCYPRPEPTGEKWIDPTVVATPVPQVRPGQTISLTFSGGYVVGHYSIVCGTEVVEYRFADELPGHTWQRQVEVRLDDRVLASAACEYDCTVNAAIPADVAPGRYRLTVAGVATNLGFDLDVGP